MKLFKIKQELDAQILDKVIEEAVALADAVMENECNARVLSKCMGVMQETFNFMDEIATQEEIEKASIEHVRKLRVGGCEIEKEYKVMEVRE